MQATSEILSKRQWQFFWIIAFIGGLIFAHRFQNVQQDAPLQLSVIHRPIASGIIGLMIFIFYLRRLSVMFSRIMVPISLFCIWSLLSFAWSVNPLWTGYRTIEYTLIISLTAYTAVSFRSDTDCQKWINLMWGWLGILLMLTWLGIFIAPEEALIRSSGMIPFSLNGVYPRINSNSVSHLGAIISIVAFCRLLDKKNKKWLLVMIWGLATIILSQGRSGLLGFIFGFITVLILYKRIGLFLGISLLIMFFILELNYGDFLLTYGMRGQKIEMIYSLSGRVEKWQHAWLFIEKNPLLGYGAFAGSRFYVMPEMSGFYSLSGSTHSLWVELLTNVGAIGCFIFGIVLFKIFYNLLYELLNSKEKIRRSISIEMIAVFSILFVRSFFTHVMITHNSFPFFTIIGTAIFLQYSRTRNS
ncbi:MAG: O-antigen ligase family protein [Spirochaetia bacterium]|nr:O-antigen ligase family protein [Spirochaetia bacterium]